MIVDRTVSAWDSMLNDAYDSAPAARPRRAVWSGVVVVLRTTSLLIVAALVILVLLPAVLTAQASVPG